MIIIENGKEVLLSPIPELLNQSEEVYKNYLADNENGRIYNIKLKRFLIANPNKRGYVYVGCGKKVYGLHTLIMSSVYGVEIAHWRKQGLEVNHIAKNSKHINRMDNLELITHKQQFQDKHDPHVRTKMGKGINLTIPEVREILQAWIDYEGDKRSTFIWEMVEKYGVGYDSIWNLLEGRTYKNLENLA